MNKHQRQTFAVLALMILLPLAAWGGCYLSDPLFGNDLMIFHGQVLDEAGDPVAGAVITAENRRHRRVVDLTMGWDPNVMHTVVVKAVTDEQGRFTVRQRGYRLWIKSVQHRGRLFSNPKLPSSYDFPWHDYPPGSYARPDDPEDPVIFRPAYVEPARPWDRHGLAPQPTPR